MRPRLGLEDNGVSRVLATVAEDVAAKKADAKKL
jgi:hypothetical protein